MGKLHKLIERQYHRVSSPGRPPIGSGPDAAHVRAQQCFGLSGEGIDDADYDTLATRGLVGIDLNRYSALDATTLLKFRHLLRAKGTTR